MAEVEWQARRISDSVLVNVTADTESGPFGAPVPNPIEGTGGAGVPDPSGAPDGQVLSTNAGAYALGTTFTYFQDVDPLNDDPPATPTDGQTWCDTSQSADGFFFVFVWMDAAGGWCSLISAESLVLVSAADYNTLRVSVRNDGLVKVNVPTVNPNVAGCLWSDAGVLKVSAG